MGGFKKILIVVGIAVVIGVSMFTVSSDEAVKFNDAMVDAASAVDMSFAPLQEGVGSWYSGETVDPDAIEAVRQNILGVLTAQEANMANAKVPDSDLCREFSRGVTEYIANSRAIAEVCKDVVQYMRDHNPAVEEDVAHVDGLIGELITRDQELFAKVGAIQKQMAAKYNFKLE